MKITAKIFPIGKPAVDGSIFTRKVLDEYLRSDSYRVRMETKTMLGSITHRYRDKDLSPSQIIAPNDQMLLDKVITHYVSRLYLTDDFLMGEIKFLDENLMDEVSAMNIKFVKGLLLNGIYLPVSAAVLAEWDKFTNTAIKIIDISGVDFTLDPGFHDARVVDIKVQ